MNFTIKRRDFLKTASGLTAFSLGLGAFGPDLLRRRLLAQSIPDDKNLVVIFLRGGVDAISMVAPHGDSQYNATNRPTLFRDPAADYDLGNGFAALHPALVQAPYYGVQELWEAGQLAVLHRIGYKGQSQSHFDSQQYWENGTLDSKLEVGMFNRLVQETFAKQGNTFSAAGLSSGQLVMLKGSEPIPNFSTINSYSLGGNEAQVTKFLGRREGQGTSPRGLLGFYGSSSIPSKPNWASAYHTGLALIDSMKVVGEIPSTYTPENGAIYASNGLGQKFMDTARLLKLKSLTSPSVNVNVVAFNQGGYDTHTNQAGGLSNLLYDLGRGIGALAKDLGQIWQNTVVITMSEFGRTSMENGSLGTDHGNATAMMVAGGPVNGGVYNCDPTTWANGDVFSSSSGRYLRHRTDFRCVIAEILEKHFGDSNQIINKVIPGYDALKAADPALYAPLNVVKTI
jgi:uncharacterized protein (DUF1501 family)